MFIILPFSPKYLIGIFTTLPRTLLNTTCSCKALLEKADTLVHTRMSVLHSGFLRLLTFSYKPYLLMSSNAKLYGFIYLIPSSIFKNNSSSNGMRSSYKNLSSMNFISLTYLLKILSSQEYLSQYSSSSTPFSESNLLSSNSAFTNSFSPHICQSFSVYLSLIL